MKEQLISFETAKLAKEKGFNVEVLRNYLKENLDDFNLDNTTPFDFNNAKDEDGNTLEEHPFCSAPTQSVLQKWLREKKYYHVFTVPQSHNKWSYCIQYISLIINLKQQEFIFKGNFNSHEEALEIGEQEVLKQI